MNLLRAVILSAFITVTAGAGLTHAQGMNYGELPPLHGTSGMYQMPDYPPRTAPRWPTYWTYAASPETVGADYLQLLCYRYYGGLC